MSTTAPDARFTTYNPTVPTTEFEALFPIFTNGDLSVYIDGVERSDFTVTASYVDGVSNNAKVIMSSGVTGSVIIVGERDPHRQNRFGFGPIPPRDINLAFDTVEGEMQEARRDIDRSVRSEIGQAGYILDPNLADGDVPMKQGDRFVPGPNLPNIADSLIAEATAQANRSHDEADRSEAARDIAAGYASDAVSQGNVPIYATVVGMPSLEIPVGINAIRVNGYYAAGDGGGALYTRLSAAPSPVQAWHKQSADGAWWEPSRNQTIMLEMFGTVKNSSPTDLVTAGANAARIQSAIDFLESDPTLFYGAVFFGKGAINFCPADTIVIRKPISLYGSGRGTHLNNSVFERALNGECSMLQLVGTGTKKVCTRRNYRASASDPNDAPLSVGFTVEAAGVAFQSFHGSIYCNYPADGGAFPNSAEKDNLGADWDVFVKSSRQSFRWDDTDWSGYARLCQVLIDSTRGVGIPELDPTYPTDVHGKGTDGWGARGFRSIGGPFLRVLGPKPKPGLWSCPQKTGHAQV